MSDPKPPPNHEYSVQLRFHGEQLVLGEITRLLGVQPSITSDTIGIMRGKGKRPPMWGYDGHDSEGYQLAWLSLDEGLKFLLKCLSPHQAKIIELSRQFDDVWWCGHFQTSFDGGPTLSPNLLTEIARYETPLFIDNYLTDGCS